MAEIKSPEQIAAATLRPEALDCQMCGIRHPYVQHWPCAGAFDDARVVAAIEADRAQRAFLVTIREDCYDPRSLVVRPLPGESIANAVGREGDAVAEWELVDALEVAA